MRVTEVCMYFFIVFIHFINIISYFFGYNIDKYCNKHFYNTMTVIILVFLNSFSPPKHKHFKLM